jgi:hypothetical protein
MPRPVLYYFPGNNANPFGHVAIGTAKDAEHAPAGYLTFGLGKGKATEAVTVIRRSIAGDVYEDKQHIDFSAENSFYKGAIMINLPECSQEVLDAAVRQFSELDRSNYAFFTQNCANAVVSFMKNIGCIPQDEKFYPPVRPQAIAKRACAIELDGIHDERKKIKVSAAPPLRKIVKLIRNDIDRLQEQIKYDEISHLFYKSKDTKQNKIKALQKLMDLGETAQLVNTTEEFDEFHQALLDARDLTSKTAKNIDECLYYFPLDILSNEYRRTQPGVKEDDVDYHKRTRDFILEDDELNEIEMLHELLENDIERLKAQIKKDKTTFVGRHFKSEDIKDYKIEKLTVASMQLEEPIDYDKCLNYLLALMNDSKMKGETTNKLQQCIDRFPYDRLPQVEEMRVFLVKMDALFITKAERDKGYAFFGSKTIPKDIDKMRAIVPEKEKVNELSAKEVYEKFNEVSKVVAQYTGAGNKNKCERVLQVFYDHAANLMAVTITPVIKIAPPTEPNSPVSPSG